MKFLIIKTSSLGDIIHSFPCLTYIKKKFPMSEIDWVVEEHNAELLLAHPEIRKVFTCQTKKWRKGKNLKTFLRFRNEIRQTHYDAVFDLQGNTKSGFLLSQVRSKKKVGFSWNTLPEWPNGLFTNIKFTPPKNRNIREDYLFIVQSYFNDFSSVKEETLQLCISEEEQNKIDLLFKLLPQRHVILVSHSSAWKNKQLKFNDLCKVLEQQTEAYFLFCHGNERERILCLELQKKFKNSLVCERFSLSVLQSVMRRVNLVIAMDSLALHLCGTTKTPSLSFFGPTSPLKYLPLGKEHRYHQGRCPYKIEFEKRCPHLRTCKTGDCMDLINHGWDV